jgi:tetratricopeptide (TPR) repeat protein
MELPIKIQEQFEALQKLSEEFFEKKDLKKCVEIDLQSWDLFPEPKYDYINEGLSLLISITETFLKINDLKNAKKWAENIFNFNKESDFGDAEFQLGKVYFALNDETNAKEQFAIAMRKSEGRMFEGEDKKYIDLLKKK